MPAEVAQISGDDGIRSQISNLKFQISNLQNIYLKTRGEGFGEEVKRRIILGTLFYRPDIMMLIILRRKNKRINKEDFNKVFDELMLF